MSFDAGSIEGSAILNRDPFIAGLRACIKDGNDFARRKFTANADLATGKFDTKIAKMRAQLDRLGAAKASATVDINDKGAIARLAAIDAGIKKVDADGRKASSRGGGVGAMQIALSTLLPTVGPLGAVLAASFGAGTVAAGGLAVALLGVKDAVKQNTDLGKEYIAQGQSLNAMFKDLKATGAEALFASTADGARQLKDQFPSLNNQVQEFATIGGDVANNALRLILTMLSKANPEIVKFGNFIDGLLEKANAWASGTGFDKFLAYVDREGPIVAKTVGALAQALINLAAGATPLANFSFSGLRVLGEIASELPPQVVNAMAVAWAAWAISMKAADAASGPLTKRFAGFDASKLALGITAAAVGFSVLSTAGDSLVDSQDRTTAAIGATIRGVTDYKDTIIGVTDVITGNLDGAQDALRRLTDPHQVHQDTRDIAFAFSDLGDTIKTQYAKSLNAAAKAQDQLLNSINYKQGLSGLSTQLGTVTTALQKQLEVEQSLDGVGQGRSVSIKGQTFNQGEYHKALLQTNGDVAKAIGLLQANSVAASGLAKDIERLNKQQQNINDAVGEAQAKYKLSADQVNTYAAAIGVTGEQLASGVISADEFTAAIGKVVGKLQNANTANTAWLDSIDKFNKSGKTAADVGDLIAAAFQAGRGVMLDWATSNLTAATAAEQVGQVIKDNKKSISENGTLLGQLVKVGEDWRIQQPKLSAGGLAIAQSLTQQATAAQAMAGQTYQNEVNTKGAATAAQDAIGVYLGYRNELIRQAEQSGLTRTQAHALADQYLAVPKDVKTFISQIGKKDVATAISDLTAALNHFSNIVATATVNLSGAGAANSALDSIIAKIGDINHTSVNPKPNTPGGPSIPGLPVPKKKAAGGGLPEGWSTTGEGNPNTWELLHKQGSKVDVYSNRDARKMLPGGPGTAMVPGFAGGTLNGIHYTTDNAYNNAVVRAQQSASNKRSQGLSTLTGQVQGDVNLLRTSSRGSASTIDALAKSLIGEVNKAASYHLATSALVLHVNRETAQLRAEAAKRDKVATLLQAANQRVAQDQQDIAQEKSSVRGSVLGTFDIGTSGSGYSSGILSKLTQSATDAKKFATLLAKAKAMKLNPALIAQLAEEGPATAGKNLEAIVNAGQGYIDQVNTQYHSLGLAADASGSVAASAKYGKQLADDTAAVKKYASQQAAIQRDINANLKKLNTQFTALEKTLVTASRTKR